MNKYTLLFPMLLASSTVSSQLAQPRPNLPPLTPALCAKSFCMLALGPYAVERSFAFFGRDSESGAVSFQDGTIVSFGLKKAHVDCAKFGKKWVSRDKLSSITYLCIPEDKTGNSVVAVLIKSNHPLVMGRFQGESEICVWRFSNRKVTKPDGLFLPISDETCVGDRMGYALGLPKD